MKNSVARGVVGLVDPDSKMQVLQVRLTAGEIKDLMEHFESYGLTVHPLGGAEVVAAFLGDRSHGVVLSVADRRYRPKGLLPGEVCLYTHEGDEVRFKNGRVISIKAGKEVGVTAPRVVVSASVEVVMDAPLVRMSGDLKVAGQVSDAAGSMQGMREQHNNHTHADDGAGKPKEEMR